MPKTEYQDEYCGDTSRRVGASQSKGNTGPDIGKTYDVQPVGGRMQEKARQVALEGPFVTTTYTDTERGVHKMAPNWRDPNFRETRRFESEAQYAPAERDPPHRPDLYLHRSTAIRALDTPAEPLAVPDVHKLRYMHNNYMTCDDWY